MSRRKPRGLGVDQREVRLEVAAKLLGKDRAAIEQLIETGELAAVRGEEGDLTVLLADVIRLRHAWWQAVADIAIDLVAAFEDETLSAMLSELIPTQISKPRSKRKNAPPPDRQTSGTRSEAAT